MNKYQRLVVVTALINALVMVLFPPFTSQPLVKGVLPGFDLVFAHVGIHVAPAFVDRRLGQPRINRITVFNGAARLAAGATDGFPFRVGAGGLRARILDPELLLNHVAAGKREYQHGGAHAMTQRVHSLGWHGNPWQ